MHTYNLNFVCRLIKLDKHQLTTQSHIVNLYGEQQQIFWCSFSKLIVQCVSFEILIFVIHLTVYESLLMLVRYYNFDNLWYSELSIDFFNQYF